MRIEVYGQPQGKQRAKVCMQGGYARAYTPEKTASYGKLRYAFEQPDETSVDMEKVYEDARPHDDEIGANGRYIAQACNAIARLNRRHGTVVIEKRKSAEQAFILRGKNELIKNEQLILPIRMSGED